MRKLYDSFTGGQHPVMPSRATSADLEAREAIARVKGKQRSEREHDKRFRGALQREDAIGPSIGVVNVKAAQASLNSRTTDGVVARLVAPTFPPRRASYLPDESTILCEAQASLK